ncbi:MAG TPA: coproporphyrinogen III oxidase, partial [Clostridiales bacterium]|nr:coproporphyrinogen III oxidase [Clostridiales bacterium]
MKAAADPSVRTNTPAVSAAYVHIPFCVRKCSYCDFISYTGQPPARQQEYLRALLLEISRAARWCQEQGPGTGGGLQSVFIGGGTPTLLAPDQLAEILAALDRGFGLAADGEYTLEANPGTVTRTGLRRIREAGFNRISFGLQAI